jgi:hypothetical protein
MYPKLTHKNAKNLLIFVMDVVLCSFDVATAHSPSLVMDVVVCSFDVATAHSPSLSLSKFGK